MSTARVDWSDTDSVIDYLVDYSRMLAGGQRTFDEEAMRDLVRRDVARARDIAALQNHNILTEDGRQRESLSAIAAPTLVVHGTEDPMFPLPHGQALAGEIPDARLLQLQKAGHRVERTDWETIAHAIHEHTAKARP